MNASSSFRSFPLSVLSPFLILGVSPYASDAEVRAAYERLVRQFPPEHATEDFQAIQTAFNEARTERDRMRWMVFHGMELGKTPLDILAHYANRPGAPRRPLGKDCFKRLLRQCAQVSKKGPVNPNKEADSHGSRKR